MSYVPVKFPGVGAFDHYPASSGFSRPDATLRWERNHCEQPFAFPSSMHVHVMTKRISNDKTATRTSTKQWV